MNETTKKIDELKREVRKLKKEIAELERVNSNYYIGSYCCNEGYDMSVFYTRLGFISEERANTWVMEQYEHEDVFNVKYFEVTKEIYDKYGYWHKLNKIWFYVDTKNDSDIRKLEGACEFEETIKNAIAALKKELGLECSSDVFITKDEEMINCI